MESKDDILKKLSSNDPELIGEAISNIKENGDISIVPSLLDILESSTDHQITASITNLLADIKESALKEMLTNRIQQTENQDFKAVLLRICWESSLDYSAEADLFLDILLKDSFAPAFEASTAIENMLYSLSEEKRESIKQLLQSSDLSEEKRFMVENLAL